MTNTINTSVNNKTILKWAGSKKQIIPALSQYWNQSGSKRYVEPFAGSACLLFHLSPAQALLADINSELIEMYEQVREDWEKVFEILESMPQDRVSYYEIRAIQPQEINDPFARAARFIYLNRFCFNGIYRINSSGKFNVPYGRGGRLPTKETFRKTAEILRDVNLFAGDFEKTLNSVRKGDFVYMDPPYSVFNKKIFTSYDTSKFDLVKINRLRNWMLKLDKKGIPFLVSYLESDEADLLSRGFYRKGLQVRRSIAGFTSARRKSKEVLISNIAVM